MESILVALIGGAVTLAGVVASNSRSRAVLERKVDDPSRLVEKRSRVEKHNCQVERTYRLERDAALVKRDVESLGRDGVPNDGF